MDLSSNDDDSVDWTRSWNGTIADVDKHKQKQPDFASAHHVEGKEDTLVLTMSLNDNKAGMQGLDKERINRIIYEASKGSKFYVNEQRKEQQIQMRIASQNQRLRSLTKEQKHHGMAKADKLIEQLEQSRDLSRSIVHIDMDAFYAAVEMLDRPDLRDQPMAVGGNSMLCTSNYIARRYGVRAGMPGFIARKLCSNLVLIEPNFVKYTAVSERVQEIFAIYDPNFCTMSLDEAYLDFTDHMRWRKSSTEEQRSFSGYERPDLVCRCSITTDKLEDEPSSWDETLNRCAVIPEKSAQCNVCGCLLEMPKMEIFGTSVEEAVREMRFRIYQTTFLTASAGIAANSMIAKVCSDRNKPNGQFAVERTRQSVCDFMRDLPIRKICGIGKVTEKMLAALGITTCCHLYDRRDILYNLYSPVSFDHFMRISLGVGSTHIDRDSERKSLSVERTFGDLSDPSELNEFCQNLSESLADSLQEENVVGKTVTLKIKTSTFEVRTRAHSLNCYTRDLQQIYKTARDLLRCEMESCSSPPLCLRLMGVRMSSLRSESSIKSSSTPTIKSMFRRQTQLDCVGGGRDVSVVDGIEQQAENVTSKTNVTETMGSRGDESDSTSALRCPVCNKHLQDDIAFVNSHIDECLSRASSSSQHTIYAEHVELGCERQKISSTEPAEPHDTCSSSVTEQSNEPQEQDCLNSTSVQDGARSLNPYHFSSPSVCKRQYSETVGVDDLKGSSSVEPFHCPVCNLPQPTVIHDVKLINQHIDECLNREVLDKDEISQLQSRETRLKKSHADKTIKRRKNEVSSKQTLFKYLL